MKKRKVSKLELGHTLAFEQVGEIKKKFDKLIASQSGLQLSSGVMKSIDLTGIQLLQYFILQAKKLGKELTFSMKIDEDIKRMLIKNGFSQLVETVFA